MIEQSRPSPTEAEKLAREHEINSLGMWGFLVSEIMLFGGLFAAYGVYRLAYPGVFAEASRHLDVVLSSVNTAVLLTSSLFMALAVHAAQENKRRRLHLFLALTALLGLAFLGVKAVEYWQEYQEALIPGLNFVWDGARPRQAELFFVLYFIMTGLHALHLTIGLGLIAATPLMIRRHAFDMSRVSLVELVGLYWHFIDVVWVFLYPMLYLIDRV